MKTRITKKELRCFYLYRCPYSTDMQEICAGVDPTYYNAGVYGWNCDIYTRGGCAITTGYRAEGRRVSDAIIKKYAKKARSIRKDRRFKSWKSRQKAILKNFDDFFGEVCGVA